jgi:hypothetical protein
VPKAVVQMGVVSMSSKAQIAANRRNAQESTGPRSIEGKRRSSLNALRHGFTAKTALIPGEQPAQLDQLVQDMVDAMKPEDPLELELVVRAASLVWRLRRIPTFEVALYECAKGDLLREPRHMHPKVTYPTVMTPRKTMANVDADKREAYELGSIVHYLLSRDIINRLTRYEGALGRQLAQTLLELRRLIASRPHEKVETSSVIQLPFRPQPEVSPPTDASAQQRRGNPGDEPPFPD